MDWLDWLLLVARVVVVFFALLIAVLLYVWMERKVIADMQTRMGPMRAGPRGILITLADGIKLFFKEGITPTNADRPVYLIAPVLAMFPAFLAFCGDPVRHARDAVRPHRPVPDRGPEHRHPVDARHDVDRRLFGGPRRLVERFELSAARGRSARRRRWSRYEVGMGLALVAVILYSGHLEPERDRRAAGQGLERRPAVPGVRGLPDLRLGRDEPSAVRPRRGRDRAGRRLPHGVLGDQVRHVLPGRVREHRDGGGDRRHAVPRRLARARTRTSCSGSGRSCGSCSRSPRSSTSTSWSGPRSRGCATTGS